MNPIEMIIKMQTMSDLMQSVSDEIKDELTTSICVKVTEHNYGGILAEIEKRELTELTRKIYQRSANKSEYVKWRVFFDEFLIDKIRDNEELKKHIEEASKEFLFSKDIKE